MTNLLDLQRCWRDIRVSSDTGGKGFTRWWLRDYDEAWLAKLGFHRLGALAKHKCLFLLGRPGAGKTSEVERIKAGQVEGFADEYCVAVYCKDIGPEIDCEVSRLPEWRNAGRQSKPVRLILDALDEGFLRDANYFNALKFGLQNLRSQHPCLRLLLVCRPAEWNAAFGKSIHRIWDEQEEPKAFVLEPLSPNNQEELARDWGITDSKGLFDWIHRNNFEEFSAWPRSFKFLADQFRTGDAGRINYTELCKRRTMRSFPEEDQRMHEARRVDRVETWTHVLMLVAASLVFCGKKGIALDENEPDCLTLGEMFEGGNDLHMPGKPSLNRVSVREAVTSSALMETHSGYHRFQNQSDLEYLAAAMLGSLKVEQRSELFGCVDESGAWRVFPQLATPAANLAVQSKDFFEWLLQHDPRVLMRVDFASKPSPAKSAAVAAILDATEATDATGDHDHQAHFATLTHSEIEEQLRARIFDVRRPLAVRQLAYEMALACCGAKFWLEFDRIVSSGDEEFLRSRLPSAVLKFGREWPAKRLQEIAVLPDNRLAGAAMHALLDQGSTPKDLAPFLREPGGIPSMYDVLLGRRMPRECSADDVPSLLAKIADWPLGMPHSGETGNLVEALIAEAVTVLDRDDVRKAVVDFFTTHSQNHDWFFHSNDPHWLDKLGLTDASHRRALLWTLAEAWLANGQDVEHPRLNLPLLPDDYPWLLDELVVAQGHRATVLAKLVGAIFWQLGEEHAEALDHAYAASSDLRVMVGPISEPCLSAQLRRWRLESEQRREIEVEEYRSSLQQRDRYSYEAHQTRALERCHRGIMHHGPMFATRSRSRNP